MFNSVCILRLGVNYKTAQLIQTSSVDINYNYSIFLLKKAEV